VTHLVLHHPRAAIEDRSRAATRSQPSTGVPWPLLLDQTPPRPHLECLDETTAAWLHLLSHHRSEMYLLPKFRVDGPRRAFTGLRRGRLRAAMGKFPLDPSVSNVEDGDLVPCGRRIRHELLHGVVGFYLPRCSSCRIDAAVNCLVMDPSRNLMAGALGMFHSSLAEP
jgi:hypothetical protein